MQTAARTQTRNQTFECLKLLASVFVVFIHIKFPDRLGELMTCLARFAVPLFFTISGYFSYRTKSSRLKKRIVHLLKLELLGILVSLGWLSFLIIYTGGDLAAQLTPILLKVTQLSRWILLGIDPFAGYLWFLPALTLSYCILWGYLRFFEEGPVDYCPLYLVSTLLLILQITFAELFIAVEFGLPFQLYRNAFFCGLPFLTLGIFLREYQDRIFRAFCLTPKKLILIIFAAMTFSALEWWDIGACEMYSGTILAVVAMVLFAGCHPTVSKHPLAERIISSFGSVSTGVYLLHMVVAEAYFAFVRRRMELIISDKEPYLNPILIALTSLFASAFCVWGWELVKRILKKK